MESTLSERERHAHAGGGVLVHGIVLRTVTDNAIKKTADPTGATSKEHSFKRKFKPMGII